MNTSTRKDGRFAAGIGGLLDIADPFPQWQRRAACAGRGNERWFSTAGDTCTAARKICAQCPVAADCLDDAVARGEDYGIWGGAGEAERRTFARARHGRLHGPTAVDGCSCAWCTEWARHRANLDALVQGRRRLGNRGDSNGAGATHGRRATYSRGCRCEPCRWSASALGQVVAAAGLSTADLWTLHVPDGTGWKDARILVDGAAREALAAAGDLVAS